MSVGSKLVIEERQRGSKTARLKLQKAPMKTGLWIIRGLFVLVASSAAYYVALSLDLNVFYWLIGGIVVSMLMVGLELLLSTQPISSIGAIIFGILLGIVFAMLLQRMIVLALGQKRSEIFFGQELQFDPVTRQTRLVARVPNDRFDAAVALVLSVAMSYVGVAVLYQTRDRFNLIIPYVEFRPVEKGARPIVVDTSVIVDGRIHEILQTGVFDGPIVIPHAVLRELQGIADSPERMRRERGRLGLDCLDQMRRNPLLDVQIQDAGVPDVGPTDNQLIQITRKLNGRLVTNDYNLNSLATVDGVEVVNLNKLANALKPIALPDEELNIKLIKRGQQAGQAVGYLEDGTMVIVEDADAYIGREVDIVVTNTITKETGRMIFGRLHSRPAARSNA
jgi:uncharacterized protein YacL